MNTKTTLWLPMFNLKEFKLIYTIYFFLFFILPASAFVGTMDTLLKRSEILIDLYKNNTKAKKPIISIAGGSSVGKSYFSEKLLTELTRRGIRAKILPLDYFLNPTSQLEYSLEPSEFNNRVGRRVWQFDHRDAHRVLRAITARESIIIEPHLDFETQVRTFVATNYAEVDLVIVEGTYALSGPDTYDLAQYSPLKIFMDADKKHILTWYCSRKRSMGHPNPEEDPITAWDFEEDYGKVIAPTKVVADMIIRQDENRKYYFLMQAQSNK